MIKHIIAILVLLKKKIFSTIEDDGDETTTTARTTTKETTPSLEEFLTCIANDDILFEIFTRLRSARTICHCAAVSKQWRSVISHPDFLSISKSRRQHSTPFTLLFHSPHRRSFPSPEDRVSDELKILHSSEGSAGGISRDAYTNCCPANATVKASYKDLLLLHLRAPEPVRICNPSSGKWVPIPEMMPVEAGQKPDLRRCSLGLAGLPGSDRGYVVLAMAAEQKKLRVAWFRSDTGRWSRANELFPIEPGLRVDTPIGTSDGIVFPLVTHGAATFAKILSARDFGFSVVFEEFSLPCEFKSGWRGSNSRARVGSVGGQLRLWQSYIDVGTKKFVVQIWKLHEEENGSWWWVRLQNLMLPTGGRSNFTSGSVVIALHPDDEDVFIFKDNMVNSQPIWEYHISTGNCDEIGQTAEMSPTTVIYTVKHQSCPTVIPELPNPV